MDREFVMEREAGFKNIEFLVVLGRGVGFDPLLEKYSATPMIENADISGDRPKHTGAIEKVDPNVPEARYGGGIMNAVAAATMFDERAKDGNSPMGIFVAAGRPPYMDGMPENITEGDILKERIRRELERRGGSINDEELIHTYPTNRDTFDDLEQSLQRAVSEGASKITFITVELHIPRAEAMASQVAEALGLAEKIKIEFRSSEDILRKSYPRISESLDNVKTTAAYRNTKAQEEQGLRDFKEGKYKFLPRG